VHSAATGRPRHRRGGGRLAGPAGTGTITGMPTPAPAPAPQVVQALPKVLLHDHLDGGLRPTTLLELAAAAGHRLPADDADLLAAHFHRTAHTGNLPGYLEGFTHTVAVMQTEEALTRVAADAVADLVADGVVYAELRYAPELHTRAGLTADQVVATVTAALHDAAAAAAAGGHPIIVRQILTALRNTDDWSSTAACADRFAGDVVAFDIAGPEHGWPASRGAATFTWLRTRNIHLTIHAGEAYGPDAIADAVHLCGAERLGHGVRLADDVTTGADGAPQLSKLACYVRDRRIALELCPTSNVGTGAAATIATHPFDRLYRADLRVTVNTDNRLMSATTLTGELCTLADTFGYTLADIARFTLNAAKASFADHATRGHLIRNIILPAYTAAGVTL